MTRAREDFARLLDGDETGRGPQGSAHAVEALVLARRELDAATAARPAFRDALRTRLLAVAAVQPPEPAPAVPAPLLGLRARRRMAALSGALAALVAVTGVGVAASRSGPGDVFYGAKRTAESVRLDVAGGGQTEQGVRRLQQATSRLAELEALSASGRTIGLTASASSPGRPLAAGATRGDVVAVLDDMDRDVRDGSALVLDAYRVDGDEAALVLVRGWAVAQADRLRALVPRLSAPLRPRGEDSLALVREVEAEAVRLLAAPAPRGTGTVGGPSTPSGRPGSTAEPASPPSSHGR